MGKTDSIEDYCLVRRFRVLFRDVDMLKHVNNITYGSWCEDARIDYFHDIIEESIDSERGIIIARFELNYESQVFFRDDVAVGARISRLGTKSFEMDYIVWDETLRRRAVWASSTLVAYDYPNNRSIEIPAYWRARITEFETIQPEQAVITPPLSARAGPATTPSQ